MSHDTTTLVTARQLFDMPDDGRRYELIAGVLKMMSLAGSEHGAVIGNLSARIGSHVIYENLGLVFGAETGFLISRAPDTVLAPDIAFVRPERIPDTGIPKTYWPGPPDLAVEVTSPHDRAEEVGEKVRAWLDSGCREVWVVSPLLRSVTIYHSLEEVDVFAGGHTIDQSRVLPDFRCLVSDIFAALK